MRLEMLCLDHLILGARDLDEGIRRFEEKTGVRPQPGGEHPGRGTRNALVSLAPGLYVEILAPQASAPDEGRAGALRKLTDLTPYGFALFAGDLDGVRRRLAEAGFGVSEIQKGSRARPGGVLLEWKTFEIERPAIAAMPFFIRWGDGTTHPSADAPGGCRLERLRILTPDAALLRRVFSTLSVDVAVDPAERGAMEVTLACPKGTVQFKGDVAAH